MQELELFKDYAGFQIADLQNVVGPMRHLRQLVLHGWDGDAANMDSILASLPALTKLDVGLLDSLRQSPEMHLPNGFAGLRHFSIRLWPRPFSIHIHRDSADVSWFARMLMGLESLSINSSSRICNTFLSQLRPMPDLTNLSVGSLGSLAEKPHWLRACCLAKMPRLQHLELDGVLDFNHWGKRGVHTEAVRVEAFGDSPSGKAEAGGPLE